eukprot:6208575-Pleurochrysis_carterae.AAC.7
MPLMPPQCSRPLLALLPLSARTCISGKKPEYFNELARGLGDKRFGDAVRFALRMKELVLAYSMQIFSLLFQTADQPRLDVSCLPLVSEEAAGCAYPTRMHVLCAILRELATQNDDETAEVQLMRFAEVEDEEDPKRGDRMGMVEQRYRLQATVRSLTALDLAYCGLDAKGAAMLATLLREWPTSKAHAQPHAREAAGALRGGGGDGDGGGGADSLRNAHDDAVCNNLPLRSHCCALRQINLLGNPAVSDEALSLTDLAELQLSFLGDLPTESELQVNGTLHPTILSQEIMKRGEISKLHVQGSVRADSCHHCEQSYVLGQVLAKALLQQPKLRELVAPHNSLDVAAAKAFIGSKKA